MQEQLVLGGQDEKKNRTIKNIHKEHKGSFYFYDEAIISKQIDILLEKLPDFEFLYSVKTNSFQPIVDFVASKGFGADAASAREVEIAREAGLTYEKILYSTPGKTKKDIESTIDKSIIIADSYNELILINQVAKERQVTIRAGLRINMSYDMDGRPGLSSKFGVDEDSLIKKQRIN